MALSGNRKVVSVPGRAQGRERIRDEDGGVAGGSHGDLGAELGRLDFFFFFLNIFIGV